jgi:hypothetical protein
VTAAPGWYGVGNSSMGPRLRRISRKQPGHEVDGGDGHADAEENAGQDALRSPFAKGEGDDQNLLLNDLARVFVIAERHKFGMTKPTSFRPFQKIDKGHQVRTGPNAFFHLLGV